MSIELEKKRKTSRLFEYAWRHGLTIRSLSRLMGMNYASLNRIANGYDCLLSSAYQIVEFSKGEITYKDLLPTKEKKKDAKNKEPKKPKEKAEKR